MKEKTIAQISGMLAGWAVAGLIILAATVGCQSNSIPDVVKPTNIRYFHDVRTDLCFAATNSQHEGWMITSITYVPCTDAVVRIINGQ